MNHKKVPGRTKIYINILKNTLKDGCISKNLSEMADCLRHMTQDVFSHHVTGEKNDFGKWVREVIGDDRLAGELTGAASPVEAAKIIEERIVWLRRKG